MDLRVADLDELDDEEFATLERAVAKLLAIWQIKNLTGQWVIYWDDQHIGEKRRQLRAIKHPSVDAPAIMAFMLKPVVDSLEGNMLWRVMNSPVVVVHDDCLRARGTWWSFGIEAVSKFREKPMAIWSISSNAASFVIEDGEWRVLHRSSHRLTKNRFQSSWVHDMQATNTRPPLTPAQDRASLGKDAYYSDEVRRAVPEPPTDDTWTRFSDVADMSWVHVNVARTPAEVALSDVVNINKSVETVVNADARPKQGTEA